MSSYGQIQSVIDSSTNKPDDIKGTNGAAHVTTMPGGIARIREENALDATAKTMDWSATPIKAVTLTAYSETATGYLNNTVVLCIDPPSDPIRDSWLTAADSLAADSNRIPLIIGVPLELSFTSAIDYIGIKRDVGTEAIRVVAVGVEA